MSIKTKINQQNCTEQLRLKLDNYINSTDFVGQRLLFQEHNAGEDLTKSNVVNYITDYVAEIIARKAGNST